MPPTQSEGVALLAEVPECLIPVPTGRAREKLLRNHKGKHGYEATASYSTLYNTELVVQTEVVYSTVLNTVHHIP